MPVTTDIVASYRRPRTVVRGLLTRGPSEARALAFLMGTCVVLFVAQWPRIARDAHLEGGDMNMAMGGALLASLFLWPLIFYALAALVQGVAYVLRRPIEGLGARISLFWALLAATPLALLNGLVAGFIGPGPSLTLVGGLWFAAFLWIFGGGLRAARDVVRGETA